MSADIIDYKIIGNDLQAVVITLDPGESAVAEAGAMMYMEDGIEMGTSLSMKKDGGGILNLGLQVNRVIVCAVAVTGAALVPADYRKSRPGEGVRECFVLSNPWIVTRQSAQSGQDHNGWPG